MHQYSRDTMRPSFASTVSPTNRGRRESRVRGAPVAPCQSAIAHLITSLEQRNIRVLGIEGVDAASPHDEHAAFADGRAPLHACAERTERSPRKPKAKPKPTSLLLESPVRSGQSIVFSRRRRHGAGFGRFRRGDRRRRVYPHLRNASRPRDGGDRGQCIRTDFLPEDRSRTARNRRLLPDCGRHKRQPCATGPLRHGWKATS